MIRFCFFATNNELSITLFLLYIDHLSFMSTTAAFVSSVFQDTEKKKKKPPALQRQTHMAVCCIVLAFLFPDARTFSLYCFYFVWDFRSNSLCGRLVMTSSSVQKNEHPRHFCGCNE